MYTTVLKMLKHGQKDRRNENTILQTELIFQNTYHDVVN